MNPNGRIEVFAIGTDHAVWHKLADRARIRSVERLGQPERPRQQRPVDRQLVELLQPRPEWRFARRSVTGGDGATSNTHQTQQNCRWTAWNKVS
jgi:hypothetical protein